MIISIGGAIAQDIASEGDGEREGGSEERKGLGEREQVWEKMGELS